MSFQMIGGDTQDINQVVNQVNQNIAQLKVQDTTNIFKDDTGTRRVLLGKGKDGFYGLKVSETGVDVFDAADSELVFNSNNNVFKIVRSSTLTLSHAANSTVSSVQYVHNLGFAPLVVAYWYDASNNDYTAFPFTNSVLSGADAGKVTITGFITSTPTYVLFSMHTPNFASNTFYSSASTFDIKYYILQETAN